MERRGRSAVASRTCTDFLAAFPCPLRREIVQCCTLRLCRADSDSFQRWMRRNRKDSHCQNYSCTYMHWNTYIVHTLYILEHFCSYVVHTRAFLFIHCTYIVHTRAFLFIHCTYIVHTRAFLFIHCTYIVQAACSEH